MLTDTTGITPTTTLTDTAGITPTTTADRYGRCSAAQPQPAAQGQIPAPVANPNAQPVSLGTQLDANGWIYTYPDASYVLVLGKQIGSFTAQGTYLHVLVWVGNNTGTAQPIPAGFFALKDAQGTVYAGQAASLQRRRAARSQCRREHGRCHPSQWRANQCISGVRCAARRQGLFLFAAGKPDQGWPLNVVP